MAWTRFLPQAVRRRMFVAAERVQSLVAEAARRVPAGGRVLDVAAGECVNRAAFQSGVHYVAVDRAVGNPKWDYGRLSAVADAAALPFRDDSFDALISTLAFSYFEDSVATLVEWRRVTKPGGTIAFTAPMAAAIAQAPYDLWRFTDAGLAHLARKSGIEIELIASGGGVFTVTSEMLKAVHRHLFHGLRNPLVRILLLPLRPLSSVVLTGVMPLVLGLLDGLDRRCKITPCYTCLARRPLAGLVARGQFDAREATVRGK